MSALQRYKGGEPFTGAFDASAWRTKLTSRKAAAVAAHGMSMSSVSRLQRGNTLCAVLHFEAFLQGGIWPPVSAAYLRSLSSCTALWRMQVISVHLERAPMGNPRVWLACSSVSSFSTKKIHPIPEAQCSRTDASVHAQKGKSLCVITVRVKTKWKQIFIYNILSVSRIWSPRCSSTSEAN